jgi:hypothetical protein
MTDKVIGRKPEPAEGPPYPGPFVARGNVIYDADGWNVLDAWTPRNQASNTASSSALAELVVNLLNREMDGLQVNALKAYKDRDGDLWYEVKPGQYYMSASRSGAQSGAELYPNSIRSFEYDYTPWTLVPE